MNPLSVLFRDWPLRWRRRVAWLIVAVVLLVPVLTAVNVYLWVNHSQQAQDIRILKFHTSAINAQVVADAAFIATQQLAAKQHGATLKAECEAGARGVGRANKIIVNMKSSLLDLAAVTNRPVVARLLRLRAKAFVLFPKPDCSAKALSKLG